jgi:protease-4
MRVRKENRKKIIASVESVGASGAYYIASACDRIYANNASVVGSIGVIMEWTNYGELLRWAKLKNVTIQAGELKSAGDPSRDLTLSSSTMWRRAAIPALRRSNRWPPGRYGRASSRFRWG